MKKTSLAKRLLAVCLAIAMFATLVGCGPKNPPADSGAAETGSTFLNTTGDDGANYISLTDARSFKAVIPIDKTEDEAKALADKVFWSLDRDPNLVYSDETLYPYQNQGGELDRWLCSDGETPLFSNVATAVETVDGKVCLVVTFDNTVYFYDQNWETEEWFEDPSVPHYNGGAFIDDCGYFNLTATLDGTALGTTPVKIVPYDDYNTMPEIYEELDEMVTYAADKTDLYVEKFSMGKSAGDYGLEALDMPYLIVARDKEAVEHWKAIREEATTDPEALLAKLENGELGDYQVPVMYSNVHANEVAAADGIMKFAWMLLESAAGDKTIDYDKLTGFTEEGEAQLKEQMGEQGVEGSVAVPDLVKDTATYLGWLREDGVSVSDKVDLEKYYTSETDTVKLDELLDNIFFILVPEENVEGRTYLCRTSSGGMDLNRDNSFQTQAETQNMAHLIADWNPVSLVEFHGRIEQFQCEPCDPPHEPNFEYDLLAKHLMPGGEALGIAAITNNDSFNSYVIPQRDYLSYNGNKTEDGKDQTQWFNPWDDMSTSYTPQYSMLQGTVAYTCELPAYNDDTVRAAAYGIVGQSDYIAENKDGYLAAQAEIFKRGVNNENSDEYDKVGQWLCDQYDEEGAEINLFRPEYDGEGQNGNFYPECYVIPLDGEHQKNLPAAKEMLDYLARNDVKVMSAKEAFTYDGVEYPAGTAVVSMYQAKRSVANGMLYKGTYITSWPILYSEGITAFNKTRGFDMATCAEPAAYETIAAVCEVTDQWDVKSYFTGTEGDKVILSNASEDSTAAVNELLKAGKSVGMILGGETKGSFLLDFADWKTVSEKYILSGEGVTAEEAPLTVAITKSPVLYICGKPEPNEEGFVLTTMIDWNSHEYNYDRQAMRMLGFDVTDNAAEADLIIGNCPLDDAAVEAIQAGTPYMGYGPYASTSAQEHLFDVDQLSWNSASEMAMDALGFVTYPEHSMVTASYAAEGDDILYGFGTGYFETIPEGAKVLVQMDPTKAPLEGFMPAGDENNNEEFLKSVQAFAYKGKGADGVDLDVVLFGNTLTNKVHQRDEFNFISNTAFSHVTGDVVAGAATTAEETELLNSLGK